MRALLKKFPDLERLLSKVHAAGDKVKSEKHPDSRAVFFEAERYSKRKIWDMLTLLEGFKQCKGLVELLSSLSTKSKLLQEVARLKVDKLELLRQNVAAQRELKRFDQNLGN